MGVAFGYRKASDLPKVLPVFPLTGALLFPRGQLPLNIFEPRYLNMIDDALSGARLIGMIQPDGTGGRERPGLSQVGCVGRLTSFSETDDGRYLITLTGVARFRVLRELQIRTPYRQVEADFAPYEADLSPPPSIIGFDRAGLMETMRIYLERRGLKADWDSVEQAPPETLVNALAALCPFDPPDKQALLEAMTVEERRDALVTLMAFDAASEDDEDDDEDGDGEDDEDDADGDGRYYQ
jgi:uncharacterized protein